MPRDLTGTTAATERFRDAVEIVFLVEITLDQFGIENNVRHYASRKYTLSAQQYQDLLATQNGIQMGWSRLQTRGGLASIGSFSVILRNEERESDITDTYVAANDQVIVYAVFATGAETSADRVEIARGIIDDWDADAAENEWSLELVDDTPLALRKIPLQRIDPTTYPDAPTFGEVVPVVLGAMDVGPWDGGGQTPVLAPYRAIDIFGLRYISSFQNKSHSTVYQWYEQARRFAEVLVFTHDTEGILTASDPQRKMLLAPVRPKSTNTAADWQKAADNNTSTGVALSSGDKLHLWYGGSSKLGTLTALSVEIQAMGTYTYNVKDDTVSKASGSATGNTSIALVVADFLDWDLNLLNIEIDGPGTGQATITETFLDARFDDQQSIQGIAPRLYGKVQGWEDQPSHYADGGVVDVAGAVPSNPGHLAQILLRGSTLMGRQAGEIDTASSAEAVTARSGWQFAFALDRLREKDLFDQFGQQAGLHLFFQDGQWHIVPLDKSRPPKHFFHGDWHMPVRNGDRDPSQWRYRFKLKPLSTRDIVNELALRYRPHPATQERKASEIASGQFRLSGTCSVDAASKTLVDPAATFMTKKVLVNERIYVSGYLDLKVTAAPTSETQISIDTIDGGPVPDIPAGTAYWLGAHLDGRMLLSQFNFKTINALGVRQEFFTDEGGFESDFVVDQGTAQKIREYMIEWFSQPRRSVQFFLFHSAVDLLLGDVFYLYHDSLSPLIKPTAISSISGTGLSNIATILDVAAGQAGIIRNLDYLFSWSSIAQKPEVWQVTALNVPANQVTITRAMLNTEAVPHAAGDTIYRLTRKWMVTGILPMSPTQPIIGCEAELMPNDYLPIGKVSAPGYPTWANASEAQRVQSGWATLFNGRVIDEDALSAISYVGPDTGTFP